MRELNPPTRIKSQGIGDAASNADLNPSMTPAIGYVPYTKRNTPPHSGNFCTMSDTGHTTGAAYIPSCTTKVTAWLTSRYCTESAESHNPIPSAVIIMTRTRSGRNTTFKVGTAPNHNIIPNRNTNAIQKSTRLPSTGATGNTSLGKYTFVMMWAFVTRLVVASLKEVEKYVQGTSAAKEKSA